MVFVVSLHTISMKMILFTKLPTMCFYWQCTELSRRQNPTKHLLLSCFYCQWSGVEWWVSSARYNRLEWVKIEAYTCSLIWVILLSAISMFLFTFFLHIIYLLHHHATLLQFFIHTKFVRTPWMVTRTFIQKIDNLINWSTIIPMLV